MFGFMRKKPPPDLAAGMKDMRDKIIARERARIHRAATEVQIAAGRIIELTAAMQISPGSVIVGEGQIKQTKSGEDGNVDEPR